MPKNTLVNFFFAQTLVAHWPKMLIEIYLYTIELLLRYCAGTTAWILLGNLT